MSSENDTFRSKIISRLEAENRAVSKDEIALIVEDILSSMKGRDWTDIHHEIQYMASHIQSTKQELANIEPQELRDKHLSSATDELDAVVGATEDATGRILDAAEAIQNLAMKLSPEQSAGMIDQVTAIFEACNFQDITGQRISKVVRALKHIETKVDILLQMMDRDNIPPAISSKAASSPAQSDEDLLNGPQMPVNAIDQDEIDKLLNG